MEYYPFYKDENGNISPVFRMLFRIEIPRSEFTYVNAMNKIIELNDEYRFDWIGIDRGYGEYTFVFLIFIWYYLSIKNEEVISEVISYERTRYRVA